MRPGSRSLPPALGPSTPWNLWNLHLPLKRIQHVRVFAGKADPVDEARFTLPYEVDGVRGFIDCRLQEEEPNEAEHIIYHLRDGSPTASTQLPDPK